MGDTETTGELLCPVKSINLLAAQNQNPEETIRSQSPKGPAQKTSSSSTVVTDQPVIDPTTSETLFRNLRNAKRFAIDIGGSLTKIAYFSTVSHRRIRRRSKSSGGGGGSVTAGTTTAGGASGEKDDGQDSTASSNSTNAAGDEFDYEVWEGARLHFIKFETLFIEECLDFIQKHLAPSVKEGKCEGWMSGKYIKATGKS